MDEEAFDVVLFDLGGVLVDFGGVDPMKELAGIQTDDELWRRWLSCPWVRRFERGHCSPLEFATGMVEEWSLPITASSYLEAFEHWPGGLMDGAAELVHDVQRVLPVGCLSNTNIAHWNLHFGEWPVLSTFDHRFLSFEMGMVKPDLELFVGAAERIGSPPDRLLFLDDNALNVDAALAAGFVSVQVKGPVAARRALVELEVLAP